LLGEVGFAQHLVVEIDLDLVFELAVVRLVERARQVRLDIHQRVGDAVAIRAGKDLEIAASQSVEGTVNLAGLAAPARTDRGE
jgi:hypothetical protein